MTQIQQPQPASRKGAKTQRTAKERQQRGFFQNKANAPQPADAVKKSV
jgi:hypothetical protein